MSALLTPLLFVPPHTPSQPTRQCPSGYCLSDAPLRAAHPFPSACPRVCSVCAQPPCATPTTPATSASLMPPASADFPLAAVCLCVCAVCVHTTLRDANDRGYECCLLSDCAAVSSAPAAAAAAAVCLLFAPRVNGGTECSQTCRCYVHIQGPSLTNCSSGRCAPALPRLQATDPAGNNAAALSLPLLCPWPCSAPP